MRTTLLTLALVFAPACSGAPDDSDKDGSGDTSSTDTSDSGGDTDTDAGTDTSDSGGGTELNGEVPDPPVDLPEFVATAMEGSARGPDDLRGHPTVLWFYPAAGTAG